jgi:hypothetical protein
VLPELVAGAVPVVAEAAVDEEGAAVVVAEAAVMEMAMDVIATT